MKQKMILMPEKNAPLVHLELALLHGSLRDPAGKEGTASMTLSMLLRGTKKRSAQEFHRALDNLGAEIYLGKYKESMRVQGVVLADKLPEFLDLWEELLTEPAFPEEEFKKVREQLRSAFMDELGSDDSIADRRFQEYLLWGNLYGRMTSGSLQTIDNVTVEDLRAFHREYFRTEDFVIGASGGFDKKMLEKRFRQILAKLTPGSLGRLDAKAPTMKKGKTLLLLDKPGRSQAQILMGSPGVSFENKDYFAMLIANHVFGGSSFSARLMKEVREKRGWSYGAYSWYRSGRKPLYFAMQAVPSNKDAIPALELMAKLFSDYGRKGITKPEFEFAKKSLVSQSAFLQDTVRKRLDNKVTEAVMGLPAGFYDHYRKKLQGLTYAKVQGAIRRNVDASKIFAVMLVSVDEIQPGLKIMKGFSKVWRRKFDEAPGDIYQVNPYSLAARRGARKEVSGRTRSK
jgi:zinc protease